MVITMKKSTKTIFIIAAIMTAALLASCSLGLVEGTISSSGGNKNGTDVYIESTPCFEYEGLSVTARSLVNNTLGGKGVLLDVTNDSSFDMGIGTSAVIVNGYMVSEEMGNTVEAGKGSALTVHLYTKALEAVGITTVRTIEIHFYVYDALTRETLYEAEPLLISTSAAGTGIDTPVALMELYSSDTATIGGKYTVKSDYYGSGALIRVDNCTDRRVIVSCDSMLVGGKPVAASMSSIVYPGAGFYGSLPMECGEDGIPIGTAEMSFSVRDALTGELIAETGLIKLEK